MSAAAPSPPPASPPSPQPSPATNLRFYTDDFDLGGVVYAGPQPEPMVEETIFQMVDGVTYASAMRFEVIVSC